MRRSLLAAGAVAALACTLTACGSDSAESSSSSVALAGSSSSTSGTAAPVSSSPARSTSAVRTPAGTRTTAKASTAAPGKPPANRVAPGALVSGEGFLRPGSGADYQFTVAGGKWTCVVTQAEAGCTGPLGRGAPAGAGGIAVTADGKADFAEGAAAEFKPRGAAKELPAGRTLPNGTFVCTAFTGGVQCETASGSAGFKVTEAESVRW